MSFPRAKVQRFNDVKPMTPSPASYNTQVNNKAKGALISHIGRSVEKSPAASENGSTKSSPCFRTPTLPVKKKVKTKINSKVNLFPMQPNKEDSEQLKEKIVECNNKDLYIKELTEQMDEIKDKLLQLEQQKSEMELNKSIYEENSIHLIEEYENKNKILIEKHSHELEIANKRKLEMDAELKEIKNQYISLKEENKRDILMMKENMDTFEKTNKTLVDSYNEEIEKLENMITDIKNKHQQEVQEMEYEMLKVMTELETKWISKLKNQEKQSEAILKECQAISEYSIIQCELEKNDIKTKLNDEINQKHAFQHKYDEISLNYNDLNLKYSQVQEQLAKVIIELNETRTNLSKIVESQKAEIKQVISDKRAYQITMTTCQETIEVLKKRLINSDGDVEQLKQEISSCEERILEYENKCMQLTSDLRQAQDYNEELEMQYESTLKINETEINLLKQDLLKKVENYKIEAEQFSIKSETEKKLLEEAMQQLTQQQKLIVDSQNLINNIQGEVDLAYSENEEYKKKEETWNILLEELETKVILKEEQVASLQKTLSQLQEKSDSYCQYVDYYKIVVNEYEKEIEELAGIRKKYIEQSGKYDDILQKYEALENENVKYKNKVNKQQEMYNALLKKFSELETENEKNKRKIEEQRILIGPFKAQLEAYELEKDALLGENRCIEKEAREISNKYAEILGHQNNKQKIKHLMSLKEKNCELFQNKIDLEKKLKIQISATEKLKNENDDLKKCLKKFKASPTNDKENIGSPNRSLNSSRIDSPGPLKERN